MHRRAARLLMVAGVMTGAAGQPVARAAWSGFERPSAGLCTFGSPLRERYAAVIITGRFDLGLGRAKPRYDLVFTADDGIGEISRLAVMIDEREIARFDVESHVPAASGASAVVALDTETLGTLVRAVDSGSVLHVRVPARASSGSVSYDFDLAGFAKAADVFTECMLQIMPAR